MPTSIFDVSWIRGAADCRTNADPLLQVYRFDEDTFIIRENKCYSAEGNFMYLLLGTRRAILLDSGAVQDPKGSLPDGGSPLPPQVLPLAREVGKIIAQRSAELQHALPLTVAHTHSRGDHMAWDKQLKNDLHAEVIGPCRTDIKNAFGLTDWPDSRAVFDLGGRQLDIFPIPGHEPHHIAVYDRNTRILFTGDMLYPGVLTVPIPAWEDYRLSAARLAQFAAENPVSLVLGAHIEAKKTPGDFYDPETRFQPKEHVLPLGMQHIHELNKACQQLGNSPTRDVHNDFKIEPYPLSQEALLRCP
jgi:hydroxyacylglutathione hydrolase